MSRSDLEGARSRLKVVCTRIESEPTKLRDLDDKARGLLSEIEHRLGERRSREVDHSRLSEFLGRQNEALFHDTQFTGRDLASNQQAIRAAARAALAVFAAPGSGDSWALGPIPATLTEQDQSAVKEGCYGLLLLLAEAAGQPAEGLRILEQAARLCPPTMAYHLRRAACLARAGDQTGAERERSEAQRLQPTTAFDHFLMGQERYKRGDWRAAIRSFDTAIVMQRDHFWAHCLSAICDLQLKRYAEAKAGLGTCLHLDPNFAWLYVLRGFASSQLAALAGRRPRRERRRGTTPFGRMPINSLRRAQADFRHALALLDQKPNDDLRYVLLVNRGEMWLQRANWPNAVADLEAAVRLNGRQTQAHEALALVYQRQRKRDEAFEQFSRAIALRPDSAPLYRGRADLDLASGDLTPARASRTLRDLEQAIRLEVPGNPVLARDQTNRGRLLHGENREAQALEACEAALKVVPDYSGAHQLRIQVLLELKRFDEVLRSCDALLAKDKTSAALFELRGLARAGLKDFAGAIEDDTQAIAIEPARALLYVRRGGLHLVSDAPKLALHDFEAAIRLDPSSSDAVSGRGAAGASGPAPRGRGRRGESACARRTDGATALQCNADLRPSRRRRRRC